MSCDTTATDASNSVRIIVEAEDSPLAERKFWSAVASNYKFKGEVMKRRFMRVLVAIIGVAALGVTAKAQTVDFVVVTVPFQFVVDGQTLPAGTYRVKRLSDDKWQGLLMSSFENRVSVVVHPNEVESAHSDTSKLTFTGDQHFLSQVKTGDNVFNIQVSHQAALLASTPSKGGNTSGSANGSN